MALTFNLRPPVVATLPPLIEDSGHICFISLMRIDCNTPREKYNVIITLTYQTAKYFFMSGISMVNLKAPIYGHIKLHHNLTA
jgi:hypothetical protein